MRKALLVFILAVLCASPGLSLADSENEYNAYLQAFEATDASRGEDCQQMMLTVNKIAALPEEERTPTWFGTLALRAAMCLSDVRRETTDTKPRGIPGGILITTCRRIRPYLTRADRESFFADASEQITQACAGTGQNYPPSSTQKRTKPPTPPTPTCPNPNSDVTVMKYVKPEYPESARYLNRGEVTAQVEVTVDATGKPVAAMIYKSANNLAMDQAALQAARQSSYTPKLVDCTPTQGEYLFRADFQPR